MLEHMGQIGKWVLIVTGFVSRVWGKDTFDEVNCRVTGGKQTFKNGICSLLLREKKVKGDYGRCDISHCVSVGYVGGIKPGHNDWYGL